LCHVYFSLKEGRMVNDIQRKNIKVGNLDIHYLTGGQGDPLIVIHGGSEGAKAWVNNMEELTENYTVYVPDLPGFGNSQPLEGKDYFIPELTEFLEEFARSLGLESFHLMGHSLGGGVVLHYALKFPHKIKKLVLVSSLCLGKEIALWVRFLANRVLCRFLGKTVMAVFKAIKWLLLNLFASIEFVIPVNATSIILGSSITTLKEQTTVLVQRLSEIMVPTLVVWGAKDPIVPVRQAYATAELIPDCQVKVFEDAGHSVYRDNIGEFSRLLTKFLG